MYWCINGGVYPVNVKPVRQQRPHGMSPVVVYRSKAGMTYAERHIRTWEQLSRRQKAQAYRDACDAKKRDALWQITVDPTLKPQYQSWIKQIEQERDNAIAAIERGENVDPPRRVWD